jgi:hypothetical protein
VGGVGFNSSIVAEMSTEADGQEAIADNSQGWGPWQKVESTENRTFTSGFSNMELGGYLDYSYFCEQAAETRQVTPIFWYRLDDLVETMSTGKVEYRCTINDEVINSFQSTATLVETSFPTCLIVQSDIGGGVNIRKKPESTARLLGFLSNGDQIMVEGSPMNLSTDTTGRTWLNFKFNGQDAWSSVTAKDGGHVNYRMCP